MKLFWDELYMARLVCKNTNQEDTCYDEIGICTQNTFTILGQIINQHKSLLLPLVTFACQLWLSHLTRQSPWSTIAHWMKQFVIPSNCRRCKVCGCCSVCYTLQCLPIRLHIDTFVALANVRGSITHNWIDIRASNNLVYCACLSIPCHDT